MLPLVLVFIIFLLIFGVASFLALYQLWQFGYVGDASYRVMVLYVLVSLVIIIGTGILLVLVR